MAVAVAVTIATKELLLCLSGAVMRTSSRSFTIGDRIQVGTFRGDVIDIGALSTKLLELDELTHRRTGRSISLPNSMFLDKPVLNETFAGRYVLALLSVPLTKGTSWIEAEHQLLEAATEVCAPFLPEATELIIGLSKKEGLDPPVVQPTVTLVAEKADEVKLVLRFPTPVRQSSSVSQQILRRFLEANGESRKAFHATVEQSLEQ
jgi:small-conductance mechanosensitive channel